MGVIEANRAVADYDILVLPFLGAEPRAAWVNPPAKTAGTTRPTLELTPSAPRNARADLLNTTPSPDAEEANAEPGPSETEWATGVSLAKRLATPVGVTFGATPLREALYRFGKTQGVGTLLDRRIDPGQELEVTCSQTPLGEVLQKIADAGDMGLTQLGPLFYFGPEATTSKLRTLAAMKREELQKLPHDVALRLVRKKRWRWEDLATPRELLLSLAREGQFEFEGLELVPHDLWAAADLPPLALVDRVTLLAIQFDLTFSFSPDGSSLQLMPLPSEIAVVRRYPGGPQPQEAAAKLAALAPGAQIRVSGADIYVKATLEAHDQISTGSADRRAGAETPAAGNRGQTRIERMAVENIPVGAVLKRIASQLALELDIDHAALKRAGISLNTQISVHAERVSLDELLEEIASAAGLSVRREGRTVVVQPKE